MAVDIDFAVMVTHIAANSAGVILTVLALGGVKHIAGYVEWAINLVAQFFGR